MKWNETTISLVRRGVKYDSLVRFTEGVPSSIEVMVGSVVVAVGEGEDLFDALLNVRKEMESLGIQILCEGARKNVHPSPMLRQATAGRKAYFLNMPRNSNRPPVVDIFDAALEWEVCTVQEQLHWRQVWLESGSLM